MIELTTKEIDLISAGIQETYQMLYVEYLYKNSTRSIPTVKENATHYSVRPKEAYQIDFQLTPLKVFGGILIGAMMKLIFDVFRELLAKLPSQVTQKQVNKGGLHMLELTKKEVSLVSGGEGGCNLYGGIFNVTYSGQMADWLWSLFF